MSFTRISAYLFILIGLLMPVTGMNASSSFAVSEQQINQYLAEQGVIRNKAGLPGLFGLDYALQNITAEIGRDDPNRVKLNGIADCRFVFPNDQFPARLNLSIDTIPYYDPGKGAIYLKDLRILHLSGLPAQYQTQAQNLMPLFADSISALVGSTPVYTLDETDSRQLMIKKAVKGIRVEKGQLALETMLF